MKELSKGTIQGAIRGSMAFLKALLGPADEVKSLCSKGHRLLKGWEGCPECRLRLEIDSLERMRRERRSRSAMLALHGVAGPHEGQLLLLFEPVVRIGRDAGADLVLTPESLESDASYQIVIQGRAKLSCAGGPPFLLNGQPRESATLLDFDELEILDNRFIVLSPGSARQEPNQGTALAEVEAEGGVS